MKEALDLLEPPFTQKEINMMTLFEAIAEAETDTIIEQKEEAALAIVPVVPEISLEDWVNRIRAVMGKSVAAILDVGREFLALKKAKPHGEWEKCFKGHPKAVARPLHVTVSTAKMYMAIAMHPILSNRNLGDVLPPHWTVLYQLSIIPESTLINLINDRRITPDLGKGGAEELKHLFSPPVPRTRTQQINPSCVVSMKQARGLLFDYGRAVEAEICAGVTWIPPFTHPIKVKVKPNKIKGPRHQCECGHEHPDQRTRQTMEAQTLPGQTRLIP